MALRTTPTLIVCVAGAAIAGGLLALPPAADDPSTAPPSPSPVGRPAAATVQIADFSFGPSRTVAAGAVVQVSNADAEAHTLTAEDGAFETGSVEGGTVVSFTAPSVPGTYPFLCDIHPSMTGSLVVD